MYEQLKKHQIKGFCDVLVAENYIQGISCLIQTSGLGGLCHNTVLVPYPSNWSAEKSYMKVNRFVSTVRYVNAANCAIMVPKNIHLFPASNEKVRRRSEIKPPPDSHKLFSNPI